MLYPKENQQDCVMFLSLAHLRAFVTSNFSTLPLRYVLQYVLKFLAFFSSPFARSLFFKNRIASFGNYYLLMKLVPDQDVEGHGFDPTYVCSNTFGNSVKLCIAFKTCHILAVQRQNKKVLYKICNMSNFYVKFKLK